MDTLVGVGEKHVDARTTYAYIYIHTYTHTHKWQAWYNTDVLSYKTTETFICNTNLLMNTYIQTPSGE